MASLLWLTVLGLSGPILFIHALPYLPLQTLPFGVGPAAIASPVVPVTPVLPPAQYLENSIAHIHGYVEKPVEYDIQTYKLQPTVQQVPKIDYVQQITDLEGLAKVPKTYNVQKVAYEPKSVDVQTMNVVQVPRTVQGYVVQPTTYTRPQLSYVPESKVVKTVDYKPVVLTKYGFKYVPRDQVINGVNLNVVQQDVAGYRLEPKTYTKTGVRYSVYQYPVPGFRYEPHQYTTTRLLTVPITERQLGIKLLPKDYIVKTYQPIVLNDLATSSSSGTPYVSGTLGSVYGGVSGAVNVGGAPLDALLGKIKIPKTVADAVGGGYSSGLPGYGLAGGITQQDLSTLVGPQTNSLPYGSYGGTRAGPLPTMFNN